MMTFEEFKRARYQEAPYDLPHNPVGFNRTYGSDISAHLPFLEFISRSGQCKVVTEFGTRDCYSTVAFLSGCKNVVHSYDIMVTPSIEELQAIVDKPCDWTFHHQSSIAPETKIDPTDLLFIDSLHTYEQVTKELVRHGHYVNKYILFHDTVSFPEINKAIDEFIDYASVQYYDWWHKAYEVKFNHGLLLLEKQ
jgi:hypothetical protein